VPLTYLDDTWIINKKKKGDDNGDKKNDYDNLKKKKIQTNRCVSVWL
jgi:hypothetical protein